MSDFEKFMARSLDLKAPPLPNARPFGLEWQANCPKCKRSVFARKKGNAWHWRCYTCEPLDIGAVMAESKGKLEITLRKNFVAAYHKGEISLEQLCRCVNGILSTSKQNEGGKAYALGETIRAALKLPPKKRGRGNPGQPRFIRQISVSIVNNASGRGRGLAVNRSGMIFGGRQRESAFERVARWWREEGVTGVTPAAVEKWYTASRSTTKK